MLDRLAEGWSAIGPSGLCPPGTGHPAIPPAAPVKDASCNHCEHRGKIAEASFKPDCLAEDAEVIKIGGDEIQNRLRPVSIGVV